MKENWPSSRTRRPRPTTACIACRDRRIKCDRASPACGECKRHRRLCERPKYGSVFSQIVLDAHVKIPKSTAEPKVVPKTDFAVKTLHNGKDVSAQRISLSPFWALAKGDKETESNLSWIYEVVVPQNNAEVAHVDDETFVDFSCCIPAPKVCDVLFQAFLLNVNPLVSIGVDHALVQDVALYRRISFAGCTLHLLSLVLAVLYSGAVTSPDVLSFEQMTSMYSLYEKLSKSISCAAISETTSNLHFLQGYLLINTCRASRNDPLSGYGFVPHAIRVAQSMKLHLDNKSNEFVQREIKSRIWGYLIHLDVEASLASGLPSMIRSHEYTTLMPSMALESPLLDIEALHSCPQHANSMLLAMRGRLQLAQKLQMWVASAPCEGDIIEYTRSIESILRSIPDLPATTWPRLYLSLQSDRARCVLQQGFSASTSSCEEALLRSARSFLEKYVRLATLPSNPNYQWYIPGLLQPLHALMIVLMHLTSCQHLGEEIRLSRDLVNQVFALRVLRDIGEATVVTRAIIRRDEIPKGGNPMYCLLWDMRRRAWERAGWAIPAGEEYHRSVSGPT